MPYLAGVRSNCDVFFIRVVIYDQSPPPNCLVCFTETTICTPYWYEYDNGADALLVNFEYQDKADDFISNSLNDKHKNLPSAISINNFRIKYLHLDRCRLKGKHVNKLKPISFDSYTL